MVQDEQQKCSNSSSGGGGGGGGSGGGRSSKKVKQKKIPQRGLGVAQLEKIRLEEQNKKDHQSSSSSFPFPTPLTDLSSSSTQYRPNSSIPPSNLDPFSPPPPPSVPLPLPRTTLYGQNSSNPQTGGGSGIGGSTATMSGHGYFPSMWNPCELNYDVEGPKLDPGFAFPPSLQNESNPFLPPSVMMQRKQPPPPPYYSKVNISSSSGLNLQMEPPSNQSYYSNYPSHLWPEEEKMIGMKRPWPFSLDGPLGSSNHCKFPPFVPPIYRLDESSSCRNGTSFNFEQGNAILGEGPSGSSALHVGWRGEMNPLKGYKENGEPDTLLTLAPPATTSSSKSSKAKQPIEFPASHYQEFTDFNMLPYQGYTEDPIFRTGGSVHQQPLYSFFPTNGQQIGHLTATSNDRRGETGNGVDLNLKL